MDNFSFLEPGTAPRKVEVRPLSSTTIVIQWDGPETPNGQVTVSIFLHEKHLNRVNTYLQRQKIL